MDDAQTHTVPVEPLARTRIALTMGYPEINAFDTAVESVNDAVHQLFLAVFHQDRGPAASENNPLFADIWEDTLAPEDQLTQLRALGFGDAEQVQALLAGIRHSLILHGIILRSRPKRSAAAYKKIWSETGSPLMSLTRAATPLVQRLLKEKKHLNIIITTMTPTGAQQVVDTFGNEVRHLQPHPGRHLPTRNPRAGILNCSGPIPSSGGRCQRSSNEAVARGVMSLYRMPTASTHRRPCGERDPK